MPGQRGGPLLWWGGCDTLFDFESICLSQATLLPSVVFSGFADQAWSWSLSVAAVSRILGFTATSLESKFLEGYREVTVV